MLCGFYFVKYGAENIRSQNDRKAKVINSKQGITKGKLRVNN